MTAGLIQPNFSFAQALKWRGRLFDEVLDIVYDAIRYDLGFDRVGIVLLDRDRELFEERLGGSTGRPAVGAFPAWPDACPDDCCPAPLPLRGGG